MIVDTHVHVIAADAARYPLRPSGVGSQWFREHPVSVEQFATTARAAGVDRAVLVQAFGAYGTDNSYVVEAAATDPDRFVSVGIVDPEDPAAAGEVRTLATRPGFSGVRLFAIGSTAPVWLDAAATDALWTTAAELDLRIVVALLPAGTSPSAASPRVVPEVPSCSITAASRTCGAALRIPARPHLFALGRLRTRCT